MKTLNRHPIWRNQPILLTPAENPQLVISEFFQSYHLHNIREIMWRWVMEGGKRHAPYPVL